MTHLARVPDVESYLTTGLVSGVIAVLAMFVVAALGPGKNCASCGLRLPKVRIPSGLRQTMLGGWTCKHCGAKLGRDGQVLEPSRLDT